MGQEALRSLTMAPNLAWFRDHPRTTDVLLAFMVIAIQLVQGLATETSGVNDDVIAPTSILHWLIILGSPLVIVFRRSYPLAVLAVGTATTMIAWLLDLPITTITGMVVLYSAVIYRPKAAGLRAAITSGMLLMSFAIYGVLTGQAALYVLPLVAWTIAVPILAALNVNSNQALLEASNRQLAAAEERRTADRLATIRGERDRVARELHDVVAHGLSIIVIQAGAGRRILETSTTQAPETERVSEVLSNIDGAARQSLGEMRQILGILRSGVDGDAEETQWRPSPGTTTITELVSQAADSGLDVEFVTVGEPQPMPCAVGAAAYRVVQEALTNVRKHGGPNVKTSVSGTFEEEMLTIVIEDDGRGAAAPECDGHGLIGMRERVELLDGVFKAGPRVGGGFRVQVSLPIDPTEDLTDFSKLAPSFNSTVVGP